MHDQDQCGAVDSIWFPKGSVGEKKRFMQTVALYSSNGETQLLHNKECDIFTELNDDTTLPDFFP